MSSFKHKEIKKTHTSVIQHLELSSYHPVRIFNGTCRQCSNGFIRAMSLMLIEAGPANTLEKGLSVLIQLQWTDSKMRVSRSNL